MNFRTEVDIKPAAWQIGYQDKIALLGSCFSDNIARKMSEFYFQVTCNPTGTLYNPVSIANHIDDVASSADVIIITFGTAWVYVDKATNSVVDNCEKRPATDFIRRRLSVDEIVALWQPVLERYADKRFIFTVSPIRHVKDGLHENNLSKGILLLAIEKLLSNHKLPIYFPAYEMVLDELRDYRFYSDDMLHPSPVAISFIWQQFVKTFISADTQKEMEILRALWLNCNHRSLYPGSAEDKAFRQRTEIQKQQLLQRYPWIKCLVWILGVILCCNIALVRAEELPVNYYNHADGLADAVLKDSLKAIIRNHTAIPYGSGANSTWGVFFYSDRDEEGYIMDMYCDQWYKVSSPGDVASGCNIEHSFAKSWWGGGNNDAYKDCYHLNPSNSTANSSRSNYPLGVPVKELKDQSATGSLKVGKMHHPTLDVDFFVFEPKDEYKGDFARAYFYMATCYGHWLDKSKSEPVHSQYGGWRLDNPDVGSKFAMQNDNYLEFQPWEQEILIDWHRQDPVSIKEIRRQDAVSDFQHNRNPYIDYPYLAEYIWGERAGETLDMRLLMASSDEDFVPGVSNGLRDGAPVEKPKHGVMWMVDGELIRIDSIYENKKIQSLPETPSSCSSLSTEFMGWSPTSINGSADEAPERLYTTAKEIPSVATDMVLYAVFARKTVYDDGEAASFIFDDDHQDGWTVNAVNSSGYWLLDAGHTLVSPSLNLAGLSSITVKIRTYGGKQYNTLNVTANNEPIATITTTTGTDPTEYTWTNKSSITGNAPLTFSTNYGSKQGIGLVSARIEATGTRIIYSDYITSCNGVSSEINQPNAKHSTLNAKRIINGQLLIERNGVLYNMQGQVVK